ncbi:hypothetical protein RJ639_039116 [Escallonia herrerae]|uniref:Heat shock protein 70 n=1 Tax=Escallonia herrerae TaxID=1293975 RepID=A0AA88WLW7_9ASTE|nr:hypothetical protein RJ639_039116 [Escallonia herrerae]
MARTGEGPAIGIDLGTTYSCVGVWLHNRVEIIVNDQGNRTTPSCVAFTDTERLIGDAAKNQDAMNPINTVFEGPLVGLDWRPKRLASLCISLGVKLGNDTDSSDVATNCCETLVAGAVSPAVRDHG